MCRQGWLSSSLRAPIARFPRGRRSGRAPISAPCGCAGVTRVSLPVSPDFWLLFHAGFATASSVGSVRQIHRRFRPASPRCRQAPMSNRHAGEARAGSAGERTCGARRRPGTPTGLGAACRRARMVARRRACTRRSASGLGAACRRRGWWRVVGGGWWRVVGRGCGRLASGLDAACRRRGGGRRRARMAARCRARVRVWPGPMRASSADLGELRSYISHKSASLRGDE